MADSFTVNRGSDLEFEFNWPDGNGGNANLTGYTVSVFEPSAALAAAVTPTLVDAATGLIRVRVEWENVAERVTSDHSFRVLISSGTEQQTTNKLTVTYK